MKKRLMSFCLCSVIACLLAGAVSADAAVQPRAGVYTYQKYVESSYSFGYGTPIAVTPQVRGPATINYGQSRGVTSTFSASLTSSDIDSIIAKLGASYAKSVSTNENFGTTFAVAKNQVRRVYFKPKIRNTAGKIEKWKTDDTELHSKLLSTKDASGKVILKVGEFAEGVYYVAP